MMLEINGVSLTRHPKVTSRVIKPNYAGEYTVGRWYVDAVIPFNERNDALIHRSWADCLEVRVRFDGVDEYNPKLKRSGRGAAYIAQWTVNAKSGKHITIELHLSGTRRLHKL